MRTVEIGNYEISNDKPFALIAGPCQIEGLDHARMVAECMAKTCADLGIPYIFKSSYDKANRSALSNARGVGMERGLEILATIKEEFGIPVLTDVHETSHCAPVAEVVDVIQIPAFLCRQTDLLVAAGKTGAAINVKKGQFLAPWDMQNVADKIASTGNDRILLTDRGSSFGYNMLVSDFRSLPIMGQTGYPTVFDATHSVQLPGGKGTSSDGQREFVPPLARASVAVGTAAVFIETHDNPDVAPCDGPNMVFLDKMPALLKEMKQIDDLVKAGAS